MSAKKGYFLGQGTKVRMTCDYVGFTRGEIVTRVYHHNDDRRSVYFCSDAYSYFLTDDKWELIEEPTQDTDENLTKSDSFRTPKQGDKIRCKTKQEKEWSDPVYTFVCFYQDKALVQGVDLGFWLFEYWSFPPKKIQKTLAELEKELGYEEGTLEITN